jgi:ABC-type uncharacterized transport system permease subunit
MINAILDSAFLVTTPLLLTAIGGMLNRIGGLVNIGVEAMMLAGAYIALVVSSATHSWMLASVAALLIGAIIAAPFSLVITRLGAHEIVAGIGFDVAIAGIIGFILKDYYKSSGILRLSDVVQLPRIDIPGLDNAPILGAIFSNKDPITWLAWISVPVSAFVLNRTQAGLQLRAAGAAPEAAMALGLRPLFVRDISTVVAGAMAGLAGAQLSIGIVGVFSVGISAGRGFIALAAFYFGRNRPGLTAAGALLFGLFDAIQINLQGHGIAPQLVQTLPYIVVIVVLTALSIAELRQRLMRGV